MNPWEMFDPVEVPTGPAATMRAPDPTAGVGDIFQAARIVARSDRSDADQLRYNRGYRPILDVLNRGKSLSERLRSPAEWDDDIGWKPGTYGVRDSLAGKRITRPEQEGRILTAARAYEAQHPGTFGDMDLTSVDAFRTQLLKKEKERRDLAIGQVDGGGGIIDTLAEFGGGAVEMFSDPLQLAASIVGGPGGGGLARSVIREGLANAGASAVGQPAVKRNREALGEQYGIGDAATAVAADFAVGGVLGGAVHVGGKLIDRMSNRELLDAQRKLLVDGPDGDLRTGAEKDAAVVLAAREDALDHSPFERTPEADAAHLARVDAATEAVAAGEPVDLSGVAEGVDWRTAAKRVIGHFESGNDYAAKNPGSSASGKYQFTDETWLNVGRGIYGKGKPKAEIMAMKGDPAAQERFMDHILDAYVATLRRNGLPATTSNFYTLHFLGVGDGPKLLKADPSTPVDAVLKGKGARAIEANPTLLRGKTVGDVIAEMDRRASSAPGGDVAMSARVGEDVASEPMLILRPSDGDAGLFRSSREDVPLGRLWALPVDELERMRAEKLLSDQDKLVQAFGEDGAAEFVRLDRERNSMDPRRADEGAGEFDARFGDLTPEQERLAYGIGETDAHLDDIEQLIRAHNDVIDSDDAPWAAYMAAVSARGVDAAELAAVPAGEAGVPAQAAYVRMRSAWRNLEVQGVPAAQIPNRMADALVERGGWAPEQAAEIVGGFARDLRRAGARAAPEEMAGRRIAEQPSLEAPGLATVRDFDDPAGAAARAQAEQLMHDLRAELEAGEIEGMVATGGVAQVDGDVAPVLQSLRALVDEIDAEDAAVAALKGCL